MMLDATHSLLFSVDTSHFAPSALSKIHVPLPGALPQAVTFRAFAGGTRSFHTISLAGESIPSIGGACLRVDVANTSHCLDPFENPGLMPQLFAQIADMHVDAAIER